MPVRYMCSHCKAILWEFKHVGQDYYGLPTPTEVINVYGGICPNCKRELKRPSLQDIKIKARLYGTSATDLANTYEPLTMGSSISQNIEVQT